MKNTESINFPVSDMKKILDKNPNRFLLSVAIAKRARQIKEGAKPFIEYDPETPFSSVYLALKEYELGFFDIDMKSASDSEDEDLLESLEKSMEDELAVEEVELQSDEKKAKESKSKPKSKSLAA
jgi:DNA-directed RNA polymerase subunit K/omega